MKLNKHESVTQVKKFVIDKYIDKNWDMSPPKMQELKESL